MGRPGDHQPFAVAVDLVVLTIRDDRLCALVVRRGSATAHGKLSLPGGFVRAEEGLQEAAVRRLGEQTGVAVEERPLYLEQLATYGEPGRDPRMRTVSVAWIAIGPDLPDPGTATDAAEARWTGVDDLLARPAELASDHHRILADGVERARSKLEYSSIGTAFCSPEFTIGELRHVYEVVWGRRLDPGNFHRKVTGAEGFVVETGEHARRGGRRPAQLYRAGPARLLYPPLAQQSLRHAQ